MGATGKFIDNSPAFISAMDGAVPRALDAVGAAAVGYAQDLCPVDTGTLRGSITHAVGGDTVEVGTDVEYAPYVEFGTRKQRAQPFLTPAMADHVDEYLAMIEKFLKSD